MVNYNSPRGSIAYKKDQCFKTVPVQIQNAKIETIKNPSEDKLPHLRYITIDLISKWLGEK